MFDLNVSQINYAKIEREKSIKMDLLDMQRKSWDDWDFKVNTNILLAWHEQEIKRAFEEWYEKRMSEHWKHIN